MVKICLVLFLSLVVNGCTSPSKPSPLAEDIRTVASSNPVILHIGDSQTAGNFGAEIYRFYSTCTEAQKIHVLGIGSSSPQYWIASPSTTDQQWLCAQKGRYNQYTNLSLAPYLCAGGSSPIGNLAANIHADWVVFQFLGNSVVFSKEAIAHQVEKLLQLANQADHCVFITSPPNFKTLVENNRKRLETQKYFEAAIGNKCQFIKGITPETLKSIGSSRWNYHLDKVHLNAIGARKFMSYVQSQIKF